MKWPKLVLTVTSYVLGLNSHRSEQHLHFYPNLRSHLTYLRRNSLDVINLVDERRELTG